MSDEAPDAKPWRKPASEPAVVPDYAAMFKQGVEAEREEAMRDRLAAVEAKLAAGPPPPPKPTWQTEWYKPAPILLIVGVVLGQYLTVQHSLQQLENHIAQVENGSQSRGEEQAHALQSLTAELHSNSDEDKARTQKYAPMVEANRSSIEMQRLVNDQMGDRISNLVKAMQDLRSAVDTLRDMQQKTREEMLVDQARRQTRLVPGHGVHAPTPEDEAQAR